MKKNDRYAIRCNRELKKEFMALCRVVGVSPSDVIQSVMIEFNENTKRIANMKDISEIQSLLQEKMNYVSDEIQHLEKKQISEE